MRLLKNLPNRKAKKAREMDLEAYVKAQYSKNTLIPIHEISNEIKISGIQAADIIHAAERDFNLPRFFHNATFLKERVRFTIAQCVKMVKFQIVSAIREESLISQKTFDFVHMSEEPIFA